MWFDVGLYCTLQEEERGWLESESRCPPDFSNTGCQACQGSCQCSHCWQPRCHPPLFVFYSPASSSWQPAMFPLLLTILLLPSLSLSTSSPLFLCIKWFSRCRLAIWRLVDWQLTGARFLPEPVLTPGTEAQGALEAQCVADVQRLLIGQGRLATLGAPSSRQRLPCPVNTVRGS